MHGPLNVKNRIRPSLITLDLASWSVFENCKSVTLFPVENIKHFHFIKKKSSGTYARQQGQQLCVHVTCQICPSCMTLLRNSLSTVPHEESGTAQKFVDYVHFLHSSYMQGWQDSSVGVVTDYGLEGPGIEYW